MSEMKCPFCNKPLQPTLRQSDEYWCENYDCPGTNIEWVGSQKLWQELIRTKELLEVEDAEHSMCHTQILKTIEKLERTRKALEIAFDALKWIHETYNLGMGYEAAIIEKCEFALEQITTLEQKDK